MKNLILLGLMSSIMSCNLVFVKSQPKQTVKNKNECLNRLKIFVSKNWEYNPTENYFEASQVVYDSLKGCLDTKDILFSQVYCKCLTSLTIQDVEQIFGQAHEKSENALMYYNTPNWEKHKGLAGFTRFTFDTPDKKLRCILMF